MHISLHGMVIYRQWIVYKLVPSTSRPGKTDKLPYDLNTGRVVSAHNSEHWMSAEDAETTAALLGNDYGVGFVFTAADPFWFLDIDNCLVNGAWSPLAIALCTLFAGCAIEVSRSGTGLHIFGSGVPPAHRSRGAGIEFYSSGRFAAITGANAIGDCRADATAVLPAFVAQYLPADTAVSAGAGLDGPVAEWRGPTDDAELVRRAMRSGSAASAFGGKASFADLWTGNLEALARSYPDAGGREYDASGADAALAQHLAWWTGNDAGRMERMMRQSALVRDKWDSHTSYMDRTIQGAVGRQEKVYAEPEPAVLAPLPAAALPGGLQELQGIESSLLQLKTQDSVAQIFELKQAGKLLFNHSRDKWLDWDGTRWKIEDTRKAADYARSLSRMLNFEGSASLGSSSFVAGVEKFCQASRAFAVKGDEFDQDNYLLNTPAGTLDLRTGEMRAHSSSDMITLKTAVAPSAEGGAHFRKFMSEITLGDAELVEFLQVSLGSCLSGAIESHWLLFWIGAGRNGKNTLGDLVEDALGDYARTVPTSTLMSKQNAAHPTELANLQGIRVALSSEVSDGEHWDESRIKQVTGDAKISARFMRNDFFEFKRTHKHLIYGNHRPQLRSVDAAIKSRIHIVPFKASFLGREDTGLGARLRTELGYVLQWLVEGHSKWLRAERKLPACAAVNAESNDYFASQSTPEMWLAERTVSDGTQSVKSGVLYKDYADWKKERGEQPVSQTRWAETMKRLYKREAGNMYVSYQGLRLTPRAPVFPPMAASQLTQ